MKIRRGRLALMLAIVAFVGLAPVAGAASPRTVDPDTLSPALNPHYAPYDCWVAGDGIICRGDVEDSYGPFVADWFACGERTVYVAGRERQQITRWHNAAGNATKTILDTEFVDVLSLDPELAAPAVTFRSRFTKHYEYLEPGIRESRVLRQTGASLIVISPDGGVLGHETGWLEYEPGLDEEVIADMRGPKIEDFAALGAAICAALSGE